jgi:hypothetical protein
LIEASAGFTVAVFGAQIPAPSGAGVKVASPDEGRQNHYAST